MDIILKDKNGVVLHTAKKYCKEDISVKVDTQELIVNPSTEEQVKEGLFNKFTVPGDADLIPENIKKGVNIFGVDGGFDAVDTRDATATTNDIVEGTTAYVNNEKIEGNVPNNGVLEYTPSDEEQAIPAGLTAGGSVLPADITTLSEYEKCLTIANSIEDMSDYSDTTATPEDLIEGKIAYSNGERIIGTLKKNDNNSKIKSEISYGNSVISGLQMSLTSIDGNFTLGTNAANSFMYCTGLQSITGSINATKTTSMSGMFSNCTNLEIIPMMTIGKVTNTSGMFNKCSSLTDEALNIILQMCITGTQVIPKTLKNMGLTSEQVTRCQSLSNYQAFLDAGWTTGY